MRTPQFDCSCLLRLERKRGCCSHSLPRFSAWVHQSCSLVHLLKPAELAGQVLFQQQELHSCFEVWWKRQCWSQRVWAEGGCLCSSFVALFMRCGSGGWRLGYLTGLNPWVCWLQTFLQRFFTCSSLMHKAQWSKRSFFNSISLLPMVC